MCLYIYIYNLKRNKRRRPQMQRGVCQELSGISARRRAPERFSFCSARALGGVKVNPGHVQVVFRHSEGMFRTVLFRLRALSSTFQVLFRYFEGIFRYLSGLFRYFEGIFRHRSGI